MKVAVIMLGNNRHLNNDYGFWSIYSCLVENRIPSDLFRLDIRKGEEKKFVNNAKQYDVFFVSVYYDNYSNGIDFIRRIKEVNPLCTIVVGGSIYTYQGYPAVYESNLFFKNNMVDFVIKKDPEIAAIHIIEYIYKKRALKDVHNVDYLINKRITKGNECNIDINKYNKVALAQANFYGKQTKKTIYILGSRGCSANCSFCFNNKIFGRKVRLRDIDNIVCEIEECYKLGYKKYYLIDSSIDETNHDSVRLYQFAQKISERKMQIYFSALFTGKAYVHNTDIFYKLHQAGLCCAYVGCETFNSCDLKALNKEHSIEEGLETINKLESAGISVIVGIISYTPYTRLSDIEENTVYYEKLNLSGSFPYTRNLRVFVGSNMHRKMLEEGLEYSDFDNYSFVDPQVEIVDKIMKELKKYYQDQLEDINYFYRGFVEDSSYMLLECFRYDNTSIAQCIKELMHKRNEICLSFGHQYNKWLLSLISDIRAKKNIDIKSRIGNVANIFFEQIKTLYPLKKELNEIERILSKSRYQ